MQIKKGADLRFLRPEMEQYLTRIERIFNWHAPDEFEFVVTSGADGQHSHNSKHYKNLGIDLRIWYNVHRGDWIERIDLPQDILSAIVNDIKALNPEDLDVIIESTHIHVEYDT